MLKRISMLALGMACIATTTKASVPTLAETFDTNITMTTGTSSQRSKVNSAEQKIREIVHTEEFRSRILNHTYGGVKKFVDNGGLTNSQIYMKILEASEKGRPGKDNEMDLNVKTYYENSSTVGHTGTGITIYFNTKFLNQYTISETAKTLMHEWLHEIGFHHAVSYSKSRDYSVPYAVGRIIKELALKY